MILNVNLFDFNDLDNFPPKKPTFILFNPYKKKIKTTITFPYLEKENQKETVISVFSKDKYLKLPSSTKLRMLGTNIAINVKEEEVLVLKF